MMLLINPLCCVNGRVILLETISNPSNLSIFDFSWYPSPNLLYYIQICEEILNFDVIIHKPSCNPQYYVNNCIVSLESISLPLEHFIKINYFCFLEFDVIRTKTIAAWKKIPWQKKHRRFLQIVKIILETIRPIETELIIVAKNHLLTFGLFDKYPCLSTDDTTDAKCVCHYLTPYFKRRQISDQFQTDLSSSSVLIAVASGQVRVCLQPWRKSNIDQWFDFFFWMGRRVSKSK